MYRNIGNLDKILRTIVFITALNLYLNKTITGNTAYIALGFSVCLMIAVVRSYSPIYKKINFSTYVDESTVN